MTRIRKERLHAGFTREDVRRKRDSHAVGISDADLYFLQALGRLR